MINLGHMNKQLLQIFEKAKLKPSDFKSCIKVLKFIRDSTEKLDDGASTVKIYDIVINRVTDIQNGIKAIMKDD